MAYLSHFAITLSLTPLGQNTKLKYANTIPAKANHAQKLFFAYSLAIKL